MERRLALVVALAVTVVVGCVLLALGAVDLGSGGAETSGGDVAPVVTEVATAEQATEASDASATPLPSIEPGEHPSWEVGDDDRRDREHERDEDRDEDHGSDQERQEDDD